MISRRLPSSSQSRRPSDRHGSSGGGVRHVAGRRRRRRAPDHLDGGAHHELAALVEHAPADLDQAVAGVELLRRRDLALDVDRVAELHRSLEHRVAHAAQRHDALGVERHAARAAYESTSMPWAMRSPKRLRADPVGVDVLRVHVAGQRGERDDVALGDGPPAGGEAVALPSEGVEVARRGSS